VSASLGRFPLRWEPPLAVALAGVLGLLIAFNPLLAVLGVGIGCVVMAIGLIDISVPAAGLGFVIFGHLVTGQFYVIGLLPEAFAAVLDVVLVAVAACVALRPQPRSPRSHIATWLFLGLATISIVNPLVPSLNYGTFGLRQVVLPLVALLVVKEAELTPRDRQFLIWLLALGWAINVALATRQWFGDFTAAEVAWLESQRATYLVDDQIRLLGATQSNQDFGFLAAVAVPSVTVLFLASERRAFRVALGVLLLLSLAVLFGSLLRTTLVGGIVGAILAAVLVTVRQGRPERLVGFVGLLVTLLLALTVVLPGRLLPEDKATTLSTRVVSIFSPGEDASFQARSAEVWPQTLEIISEHPVGGGPGASGPLSQARSSEAPFGPVVPDNGYLLIAVQFGLVGVLLFMGMFVTWLRDLFAWAGRGQLAAAAAVGSVVAALVAMLAGGYWSLVNPSVILGVIVGLGLRGDGTRGEIRPKRPAGTGATSPR